MLLEECRIHRTLTQRSTATAQRNWAPFGIQGQVYLFIFTYVHKSIA